MSTAKEDQSVFIVLLKIIGWLCPVAAFGWLIQSGAFRHGELAVVAVLSSLVSWRVWLGLARTIEGLCYIEDTLRATEAPEPAERRG